MCPPYSVLSSKLPPLPCAVLLVVGDVACGMRAGIAQVVLHCCRHDTRKTFVFPPQPFIILASFVQEQQKSKKQPARLERRIKHDLPGQYSAPKLIRIKQHSVLIDFEILNHQEHQKTS